MAWTKRRLPEHVRTLALRACVAAQLLGCDGSSASDCPTDSVAEQSAGRALVEQRCVSCHSSAFSGARRAGAPRGIDYDTEAAIRVSAASGALQVVAGEMPKGSTLEAKEIEAVRIFLACSAAEVASAE